ncbi:MAG: hypothetical protein ACHQ5A_11615 [Opitutales bacterium]
MSVIKVHLEDAELQPIERLADMLQVDPEDVAYAALDLLMLRAREEEIQSEILSVSHRRPNRLPLWADSAGSVHAYEGMPDCESAKSKYSV